MKLIKILGLVTAVALSASAQTTGTSSQSTGSPAPSKDTANQGQKKPVAGKPPAGTPTPQNPAAGSSKNRTMELHTSKDAAKPANAAKPGPGNTSSSTPSKGSPAAKGVTLAPTQTGKGGPSQPVKTSGPAISKAGDASKKTGEAPKKTGVAPAAGSQAAKNGAMKKDAPVLKLKTPVAGKKSTSAMAAEKKKKDITKASPAAKKTSNPPAKKPPEKKPVMAGKPGVPASQKLFRAGPGGRRDPLVSPIRATSVGGPLAPVNCSTGKRCLFIPELVVQGTVRDLNGKMVAVVVNRARHTYFLRESDQVFNGSVQRITTDSVVFREYVTDNVGRESAHEVVKRVGGGPST